MYTIKYNDNYIYIPGDKDYVAIAPVLNLKANKVGTLVYSIMYTHPLYNELEKLRLSVSVLKDEKVVFKGRIIGSERNFDNELEMTVEGKLAVLNDSPCRPLEFTGTPEELFEWFLDNHNSQVGEDQKLLKGTVTVTDPNNYISRSWDKTDNTWNLMNSRLLDTLGGYLVVRYEDDGDYLDWIKEFTYYSEQSIEFGENLTDFEQLVDAEETYTACIPYGAEIVNYEYQETDKESATWEEGAYYTLSGGTYKLIESESAFNAAVSSGTTIYSVASIDRTGRLLTIESVNGGKDYLINEDRANLFGTIYAPTDLTTWEDVSNPSNLRDKAEEWLNNTAIMLKETIELSAVDLATAGVDINAFEMYKNVSIVSEPHGIDTSRLITELTIALDLSEVTKVVLGSSRRTLSAQNAESKKQNSAAIGAISEKQNEQKNFLENYFLDINAKFRNLGAEYARIDQANIGQAWVEDLMVTGNFIAKDINAETGAFTKYLTGVRILGDLIEAETLKANTLILQGEDGIFRRLNITALGEPTVNSDPKYNEKLAGSVIVAESITADKINVTDLFAQNISSTGSFNMGGKGALFYDNKTDELFIRAKNITIGTSNVLTGEDLDEVTTILEGLVEFRGFAKSGSSTVIHGGAIETGTITADKINVTDLFSQNITAAGYIKGKEIISSGFDWYGYPSSLSLNAGRIRFESAESETSPLLTTDISGHQILLSCDSRDGETSQLWVNANELDMRYRPRNSTAGKNLISASSKTGVILGNPDLTVDLNGTVKENGTKLSDKYAAAAHVSDTSCHVTSAEKQTWNNKSNFSGKYDDLINKPIIPTVPTNVSAFNNDAGYLKGIESVNISCSNGAGTVLVNKSKYFPILGLVVIDFQIRLTSYPYEANTHYSLLTIDSAYKPSALKALSAMHIVGSGTSTTVYQAAMQTTGEVIMRLNNKISANSYINVQGCYFL